MCDLGAGLCTYYESFGRVRGYINDSQDTS